MMPHARLLCSALLCSSLLCLAGCNDGSGDPKAQMGANPVLPDQRQYLLPPMHLARVVGWKKDETPTAAQGLKISAYATGLQHPRSLYVLPDGDVLVIESKAPPAATIKRPKEFVMKWVESWVTSGGDTGASNRITLLRDTNGDGVPRLQSVFLDHLNSPFGVALVGNDLYVANTDAIVRYPTRTAKQRSPNPARRSRRCRAGRSITTGPRAWPQAPTARCFMSALAPTATLPRTAWKPKRTVPRFWKSTAPPAAFAFLPAACATPMA
jgi:glucose/arabinose dehydrogenase